MVEVLDEAEAEIRAAAAWYDDRRVGLGERFLDAVAHERQRPGYWRGRLGRL